MAEQNSDKSMVELNEDKSMAESETNKLRHHRFLAIQVGVCLLGLLVYFAAPVLIGVVALEFMRRIGVGIFVFGLTSFVVTEVYSRQMSKKLESLLAGHSEETKTQFIGTKKELTALKTETSQQLNETREKLESVTRETFELVRNAQESDIKRIYASRASQSNLNRRPAFEERIAKEFRKAAETAAQKGEPVTIKMMGISQRGFFSHVGGELFTIAENALKNPLLKFEILLIDPFSAQAGLRTERESQTKPNDEYTNVTQHLASTLFRDIQESTSRLMRYVKSTPDTAQNTSCVESTPDAAQNTSCVESTPDAAQTTSYVEVRLYSTAPSCMLIFVNDSVFVDTYHYGRMGVGGLEGSQMPLLEFHRCTSPYKALEGHFEYVWFKSRHRVLDQKVANDIENPRKPHIFIKLRREFSWIPDKTNNAVETAYGSMKVDNIDKETLKRMVEEEYDICPNPPK
jgi:uncharacterized membrane protein (DUF485 family)